MRDPQLGGYLDGSSTSTVSDAQAIADANAASNAIINDTTDFGGLPMDASGDVVVVSPEQDQAEQTAAIAAVAAGGNPDYFIPASPNPATPVLAPTPVTGPAQPSPNALALGQSILQGYGLTGDIASGLTALLQQGLDMTTISQVLISPNPKQAIAGLGLSDTQRAAANSLISSWQTRFAGNTAREAAGLTPLSPADYISTENSYKAVMARAGLDAAHQDTTQLAKLIGADVSPAEVNTRINAAMTAITAEDPYVVQQLQQQFGLTQGDLIGHLLDPTTQASVIANKVTAAQVGAEASRAGVDVNAANAYALAAQGVTQAQAQQGFQSIATQLPGTQALASRYQGYTAPQGVGAALQTATFGQPGTQTQAQAEAELQRLRTQEVSAFSGSSGAGKGSLGISDTSGLQ